MQQNEALRSRDIESHYHRQTVSDISSFSLYLFSVQKRAKDIQREREKEREREGEREREKERKREREKERKRERERNGRREKWKKR
jgi:hypothetical protein